MIELAPGVAEALPKFFGTEDPPVDDPVAVGRERLQMLGHVGPRAVAPVETRDLSLGGAPARMYTPPQVSGPAFVYLHGGGWTAGNLETHDAICKAFASRLEASVVAVDYPLSPEARFPVALNAVCEAVFALAQDTEVVVAGDSAGGALAAVTARIARDRGIRIAGQVLMYPVTDLPSDRPSYREFAEGYGLTAAGVEFAWQAYLGGPPPDALADSVPMACTDLCGLAPAVVVTAEAAVLRDEGEEYAAALQAAGVPVTVERFDGLVHGFLRIAGEVPAAAAAFDRLIQLTRDMAY